MSKNKSAANDIFSELDEEDIILLTNEDGKECRFQLLDYIDYKSREFIVLLSEEEAAKEESEVDILEVVPVKGNPELESYVIVEEDDVFNDVFDLFMEHSNGSIDFME